MTPDFLNDLSRVLKYSHEVVGNLLSQLASPEHNATRWGGANADHTFRGVLADAIDETDRPHAATESALLRDPNQHVVTDEEGRVRPGQFTADHIHDTIHLIRHHLIHQYSGNGMFDSVAFSMPTVRYMEPDGSATLSQNGHLFATTHISTAGPLLTKELERLTGAVDGGSVTPHDRTYQSLLNRLRTVPHDRVHWEHRSNEPV